MHHIIPSIYRVIYHGRGDQHSTKFFQVMADVYCIQCVLTVSSDNIYNALVFMRYALSGVFHGTWPTYRKILIRYRYDAKENKLLYYQEQACNLVHAECSDDHGTVSNHVMPLLLPNMQRLDAEGALLKRSLYNTLIMLFPYMYRVIVSKL